jgi:uncharacterized protein (DUF4213/DUF364 family)
VTTTIAADFTSRLERLAGRLALPRVRALHLPPPQPAPGKDGEFCALELEDGSMGLSFVLLDDTLARLRAEPAAPGLGGADPLAVARGYAAAGVVERTVGFAAVNALTAFLFARAGFLPDESADSIGLLDPRPGDRIGMIGLFPPLVDRIVRSGARLTVLELKAHLAGERDGYRVTLDAGELHACNKVLCTSTILLNDTVDRVVAGCRRAEAFAVVGPGAGCLPDPLFDRGVTLVGGTWVVDGAALRDALRSGAPWGRSARKYAIRRDRYPGFEALLTRARPA